MKNYKNTIIPILIPIGIIAVMYLFQCMKLPILVTNLFCVITSFMYMTYWWKRESKTKWELLFIWGAFLLRLIVCVLDIYAIEYIDIPFTGGDSVGYFAVAQEYYQGKTGRFYTYYPYVINAIFQVAGLNRFAAQFVNILCWCVCVFIIQKSCGLLEIKGWIRMLTVAIYSFMPVNLIYTSSLMREAIPGFAILYLFYGILKWMKDGKYTSLMIAIMISAPGFILHNSMIAIWAALVFVLVLYSPSKQKFCIEKKSIIIFCIGILGVLGLIIALTNEIIAVQIPDFSNGIFDAINERLESFYNNYGGSTYLMNEYVYDYPSLFTGTIKRMVYFFCAPFPTFWRGLGDAAAFFMSAFVYILLVLAALVSVAFKKRDSYRFVMFFTIVLVSGIFAWMVSNSGTAMRHRTKFLGIVVLLGMYSIKLIKEEWKKKYEKNTD